MGIVYNGELYNFQSLRRSWSRVVTASARHRHRGDRPRLRGVRPDCVRHFNGMFAFAVWDRRRGTLFLARDRFGVKPLYYAWIDGALAIASEVKAFFALPGFRAQPDPEALVEYFTFQNVLSDRTLFQGVRCCPLAPR